MSIKVRGTTVIDDSKNISNIGVATVGILSANKITVDGTTGLNGVGVANYVLVSGGTSGDISWQPVTAVGSGTLDGINILEEGAQVGTAGSVININFVGNNVTATGVALGLTATVTLSDRPTYDSLNVTGVSTFGGNVNLGDNDNLYFGDGEDLRIFHNGNDSVIREQGVGLLYLQTDNGIYLQKTVGSENLARFFADGSVELYYDNSKKFETTANGIEVTGTTDTDQLNVTGVSTFGGNVNLGDNDRLRLGDGGDLEIYHNGSNSIIEDNGGGSLILRTNGNRVRIQSSDLDSIADFNKDGSVELYYDNSTKFETTGAGVTITGIATATTFYAPGGTFAAGTDTATDVALIIEEEGSIYTRDAGIYLRNLIQKKSDIIIIGQQNTSFTDGIELKPGVAGPVKLHHGGATDNVKLQTTTNGIEVTGTTDTDQLNVTGVSTFTSTVEITPSSDVKALVIDSTSASTDSNPQITLRGLGPQVIDFRDQSDTNGIRIVYRTTTNEWKLEKSESSTYNFIVADRDDGRVDLFYNGVKKFETTSYGIYVTGAGNTSTIGGAANLVLDPSAVGDNTGTVTILGNLQVEGTQTIINSTTLEVDDKLVSIAKSATNASQADGAGLEINGASATLTYASTGDKWVFNKAPYYNTDRLLTTADEGTGNGLDADTLDTLEASQFLRSDADDTTTGQIQITRANSTANGGGQIYLNGATGNRIDFTSNGAAAPSFTTRSVGTKLVLYPGLSSSGVDYGLGIEDFTLWYSVRQATNTHQHRWYGGTTQLADLKGSGELVIGSTSLTGTASQKLQVTGGAYVSGNLGIGVTNPEYKVQIEGGIFAGRAVSDIGNLSWTNTGATFSSLGVDHTASRTNVLRLMRDGTAGVVYSGFADFDLERWENSSVLSRTALHLRLGHGNLQGTPDANDVMTWRSNGNVGIGITNPESTLHLKTTSGGTDLLLQTAAGLDNSITFREDTKNYFRILHEGSAGISPNNLFKIQCADGADSVFDVDAITIKQSGNVGIGTDNPTYKLHINDTASTGAGLLVQGGGSGQLLAKFERTVGGSGAIGINCSSQDPQIQFTSPDNVFALGVSGNNFEICDNSLLGTNQRFVIDSSGNIGIGTDNPSSKLTIAANSATARLELKRTNAAGAGSFGAINFTALDDHSVASIHATADGNDDGAHLVFRTTSTASDNSPYVNAERLRITSSGDVGIGTDNPGEKLDVSGGSILVDAFNTSGDHGIFFRRGFNSSSNPYNISILAYDHNSGSNKDGLSINAYDGISFCTGSNTRQERFRITFAGDVGIGTDNPGEKLDVRGNLVVGGSTSSNYIAFQGTAGDLPGGSRGFHSYIGERIYGGTERSELLILKDNDAEDTSPGPDRVRIVGANIRFDTYSANTTHANFEAAATDSNNTLAVLIDGDGNVGIGTDNPSQKLHVKGTIQIDGTVNAINDNYSLIYQNSSASVDYGLQLRHYQGDTGDSDAAIIIGGDTSAREGNIVFYRDVSGTFTETARFDENGNFGLGIDNPTTQLHISSSSPIIRLQDTDTTNRYSDIYQSGGALYFDARDGSSNGSIIFRGVNPSSTEYARITSAGNVGIGTDNPVRPLHITSSDCRIRLEQTGETTDVELQNSNGNAVLTTNGESNILLQTNNAERMRILSTGEVGINSTAPTARLDVNGDVSIASTVSIGTTIDIVPYNDLGALSFEGSAGQLFSITNNLTSGSIFSVNDVSGIPSIDVDADGTVLIAPYGSTEYVGIGLTNPTAKLDVNGDLKVSGSSTFSGNVNLGDNIEIRLGDATNGDLALYHDGSDSYIVDRGTGSLNLRGTNLALQAANGENYINCTENAAVVIRYNNLAKIETTTSGVDVTGTTDTDQLNVSGVSTFQDNVFLGDNDSLYFGDSNDLRIHHSGTDSYIDNTTGDLWIRTVSPGDDINVRSADDITIQNNGGTNAAIFKGGAGAWLYYNGDLKFETTGAGATVFGTLETQNLYSTGISTITKTTSGTVLDVVSNFDGAVNNILKVRSAYDRDAGIEIGHLNSKWNIWIDGNGDDALQFTNNNGNLNLELNQNGSTDLFYNNSKKLETTDYGIYVTGAGNTSTIGGAANLVLDPSTVGDNTGTVTILGNLQVEGTQTIINSTTMTVDDLNITLASGAANAAAANGAGLTIDGASATLTYASTGDKWVFNKAPYYNTDRILTTADEGTGNGLDADTLDGQEGSYYLNTSSNSQTKGNSTDNRANALTLNYSSTDTFTADTDIGDANRILTIQNPSTSETDGLYATMHMQVGPNATGRAMGDIKFVRDSGKRGKWYFTSKDTSGTFYDTLAFSTDEITYKGNTIWHAGNDGSGSTLDADTLDTLEASQFLRSDAADTATGAITFSGGQTWNSNITWNTGKNINIAGESSFDVGSGGSWSVWDASTTANWIQASYGQPLYLNNNALTTIVQTSSSSDYFRVRHRSDTDITMDFYCESGTAQIADTFSGTTDKKYIYFGNPNGSSDPGYIMHETRGAESNEGVLHLVPSDDNVEGDYVSIHGTNDPDQLRLHTSGLIESVSSQLQLASGSGGIYLNDDVGIGTDTPGSTLAVGGTITELYNGTYWNVVTQADVGYGASQVPLNQYLGQLAFLDDYHPNGLRRDGGGSDDVFVTSEGRVGVGTTNPATAFGGSRIEAFESGSSSAWRSRIVSAATNAAAFLGVYASKAFVGAHNRSLESWQPLWVNTLDLGSGNGNVIMGGNVGIGTDNPAYPLDVTGSIRTTGSLFIDFGIYHDGDTNTAIQFPSNDNIRFVTNGLERVRIASDGNVGIGTDNPTATLDVNGTIAFNSTLTAGQNGKIVFPDNTSVPDNPTNEQHDYITFGANGSISQVSGRGALMIASSDDSLILANGDIGRTFTSSNINVDSEDIILLSDGAVRIKTDLQNGWGTENDYVFSGGDIEATTFTSTQATGTAPFTVSSTTVVTNLNADKLDGQEGSYYLNTSTNFGGDVSGTYNAIVITDDSHSHSFDNLTGKTSGTGDYSTNADIVSGRGSGGVALTINDGYGNANVTFNHQNGRPEQDGKAGRIEVNTDFTSGDAIMSFELGSATANTVAAITQILELSDGGSTWSNNAGLTFNNRPAFNGGTTGTDSPFTVDSTYLVTNLNADLLDGQEGSYYTNASNISSGTLAIARGGTNSSATPTNGGVAYGNGSAYAFTAAGTSGQVLTSNGTGAPTWEDAPGGFSVTNDTSTNSTYYPVFVDTTSGDPTQTSVSSTKLNFNPSTGNFSATQFTSLSDVTKKTNIRPVENALEITKQLEGVRFDWIDNNKPSIGLIAQQVEEVLPELVETSDDGIKSVSYGNIIGVLVEAIKEQQKLIDKLMEK